jgi:anti-sigma B factor antagonist
MSAPAPKKEEYIEIEQATGGSGTPVTIVRFLPSKIQNDQVIHTIGEQLYSLVEEFGRTNLLLDFSSVKVVASYLLGKLLGLKKRIHAVKGRLTLCGISSKVNPVVDEVFEVCGLKHNFDICPECPKALQTRF